MPDDYAPQFTSEQIVGTLDSIVQDSLSVRELCHSWNATRPNAPEYIAQNDTIAAVYAVYAAFWKEKSIDFRFGQVRRESRSYALGKTDRYIPISGKIAYAVLERLSPAQENWPHLDTLRHFRPPLPLMASRVLYMTPERAAALNAFLGYDDPVLKNVLWVSDEDTLTYRLLDMYRCRRWQIGRVIALGLEPRVFCILLAKDLRLAHVHLNYFGGGAVAIFEQKNGAWQFIGKQDTWVE